MIFLDILFEPQEFCKKKIKNSNKTFQVIGLNIGKEICWVREWPFACNSKKTFALEISQITLQIFCSNNSSEKLSNYEI